MAFKYSFSLLIVLGIIIEAQAQSFTEKLSIADSLVKIEAYDQASLLYQELSQASEQEKDWDNLFAILNKWSINYWRNGQWDESEVTVRRAISLSARITAKSKVADAYSTLGYVLSRHGKLDSSEFYYQKALNIRLKELNPDAQNLASSYINLGDINSMKGNYPKAINHLNRGITILKQQLPEDQSELPRAFNSLSGTYREIGNINLAIKTLQKAIDLRKALVDDEHSEMANLYSNMGNLHRSNGSFEIALDYNQRALNIEVEQLGMEHYAVGGSYLSLGNIYREKKEYQTALEFYFKALENLTNNFGHEHPYIAACYSNLGSTFGAIGNYAKGIDYLEKTILIDEVFYGNQHPYIADSYFNMGEILEREGKLHESLRAYNQALTISSASYSSPHPEVAQNHIAIGHLQLELQKIDEAEKSMNLALSNLFEGKEEDFDLAFLERKLTLSVDSKMLLRAMNLKSEWLTAQWEHDKTQIRYLEDAINHYLLMDALIAEIQREHLRYEDKLAVRDLATAMYKNALETSILLWSAMEDQAIIKKGFRFAQKSKSTILTQNLFLQSSKKIMGLPRELIELEQSIKTEISFFKTQINASASPSLAQKRLFELNKSMDSIKHLLETQYKNYFQLNYSPSYPDLAQIQKQLKKNQLFIEYADGNDRIYAFTISKTDFKVDVLDLDSALNQTLDLWHQYFTESNYQSLSIDAYKSMSYQLYRTLLSKSLEGEENINEIIIIPSNRLAFVTFGNLIDQTSGMGFNDLSYLTKKYSFTYGYSSSLFFNRSDQTSQTSQKILAIAPSYQMNGYSETFNQSIRAMLTPLKWNKTEVNSIDQSFGATVMKDEEASEEGFKSMASDYQILHLAMHALVDHEEFMNSKLVFTQGRDSIEDGMLHAFEIFNMELPADLVVLSACNTGVGEIQEGEGTMSLARAFAFAGVPSLVMSHWNANDASTSKLMRSFYEYLASGEPKGEALRKAKIDFLSEANEIEANPFFWGGFVLVGDSKPIDQNPKYYWWLLILPALGFFLLSRKKR